jgi:VanZ family protein
MPPFLEHLARIATWFCVALLVLLSLLPAAEMVRTGFNGDLEHFIAYAGTGAVAVVGYRRVPAWRLAAALVVLAGLLEFGQIFSPGRHATPIDWAASSLGAAAGVTLTRAAVRRLPRWRRAA